MHSLCSNVLAPRAPTPASAARAADKEIKYSRKYHMIKFFERQKIERRLSKVPHRSC